ncbi:putative Pre-mRNA-splicing factor 38A [Blattamonas nauphoetae]|uniref:Pre-mRNA-splicing factor 38 n=1 Tax=Blattamonas nauphoetae TaxID=2049346 RepID=A0ABQ9YCV2_9EUKA|nr:putative Pre-mRNA-splicing factor 38A [Blattamonas nauphoetae]
MNRVDTKARQIHGRNPQFLIEDITRKKIQGCLYWKEQCFALDAASIIDRAVDLTYYGGLFGGTMQPTPFLCLVLKLLQIQPDLETTLAYVRDESSKYLRILGAFYLRLTGAPMDIYQNLEPLLADYRKLKCRNIVDCSLTHVDEFIDDLLTKERVCDVILPRLPKRWALEKTEGLQPRVSPLEMMMDSDDSSSEETSDSSESDS